MWPSRPVPRASRRDHARPRRVGGRAGGGAAGGERCEQAMSPRPPARRSTSRGSCTACGATSPPPRRRTGTRTRSGGSRSPASPSCGWSRETARPRRARSGASRRGASRCSGRGSCPPTQRSRWRPATRGSARRGRRARRDRRPPASPMLAAISRAGARDGRAGGGRRRGALPPFGARAHLAGARARRTASPDRVLLGLACRALGDEDTATLELEAARSASSSSARRPTSRVTRRRGDRAAARELTPRELEVLRLVAAGRRNRQIAAELVVASTPSPGTCRTSSPSSASRRARPPPRTRSSTPRSDLRAWSKSTTRRPREDGGSGDEPGRRPSYRGPRHRRRRTR